MKETRRTVAFATLGCKLNQFETDSIATRVRDAGYTVVGFDEPADAYVINSCTVTNRADRKSRNLLYRAERARRADDSLVVLTGCYVDGHRDELESDARTYYVANERKQSIPELIDGHFRGEVVHPAGSVFDFGVADRIFHTRSTVKIQDGCDNFCTFCIIPFVRGRAQSRPWRDVVRAAREAIRAGARELVLTGVNMSRYRDGEVDFAELVSRCLEIDAGPVASAAGHDFRLRISSLEPDRLDDRFLSLFRHPRMAPHLHLCLQSGSDRVLLAMRRQYTRAAYERTIAALREIDPLFNVTTDVITGFPGETDDDFAATLDAIAAIGFGHVHTFPYSLRSGTRAERLPDHVPSAVKHRRARAVRTASEAAKRAYRERLVGATELLLVERVHEADGRFIATGLGEHYVPIRVELSSPTRENELVRTRIAGVPAGDDPPLLGEPA